MIRTTWSDVLRILPDGWYFPTIDSTAPTCEWCGASFDATTPKLQVSAMVSHREGCPGKPGASSGTPPTTEIRSDSEEQAPQT